jgi:UDPglucose 6-dehydrogenase/GDP-mannose 6-dehydrogenase
MKVTIIGAGYVGLVTGTGLAGLGHDVICVDTDPRRVKAIEEGRAPFFEPGLDELLTKACKAGRLKASTDLAASLAGADVSIIAVGTPSNEDGIDLRYIRAAAREIGSQLKSLGKFHVVTVKSTVVPMTTDTVVRQELEAASGLVAGRDFGLAMNPEFLREGCAVEDFTNPDRIVLGALDARSHEILAEMYKGFSCPLLKTTPRNAEMIKYTSNALLAALISFSNEIAQVCETIPGLDESVVMEGVHLDRRWWVGGSTDARKHPGAVTYLRAGVGFGGSCFPKDVKAIFEFAQEQGAPMPLLRSVLTINEERASRIVEILMRQIGSLEGKKVAVLGLAFKPDTDDVRESPGMKIAADLARRGAVVSTHDPIVTADVARANLGQSVTHRAEVSEAVGGADAVVIATSWDAYKKLDWAALASEMRSPVILDGRQVVKSTSLPPDAKLLTIGRHVGEARA